MPYFASWAHLRGKCLFLPDYDPLGFGVRVSFMTGVAWSAILATAGLLVICLLAYPKNQIWLLCRSFKCYRAFSFRGL